MSGATSFPENNIGQMRIKDVDCEDLIHNNRLTKAKK